MHNLVYARWTPPFRVNVSYEPNCVQPGDSTITKVEIAEKKKLEKLLSDRATYGGADYMEKPARRGTGTQIISTAEQEGIAAPVSYFGIVVEATVVYKWIPCGLSLPGMVPWLHCGIRVIGVEVKAHVEGEMKVYSVFRRAIVHRSGSHTAGVIVGWGPLQYSGRGDPIALSGESEPVYDGHKACQCELMPFAETYFRYYTTSVQGRDSAVSPSWRP
jgi:hypothetical protein